MSEGKIDYGKLANKLAGDAGKVTRKLIDFGVSVIKPENIAKVGGAVKGLADAAVDGWRAAGDEDKTTAAPVAEDSTADGDTKAEVEATGIAAPEADSHEQEQAPVEDETGHKQRHGDEAVDVEAK